MPNTKNINDVIEAIKAHPKNFKMDDFIQGDVLHSCGTAGCIAGFTLALKADILSKEPEFRNSSNKGVYYLRTHRVVQAAEILGITTDEAQELFFMPGGAEQRHAFDREPNDIRAAAAVRVLEILRDTGKVNWHLALRDAGLDEIAAMPDDDESYD